ncbi:tol-pal system YbgF family protein [Aquimarina sp. AU474]|uniref:tetratricopeptide repeat protein n=1 Tax=Aquimarina sp. AU474 TaxID=2108529 RepID=UPI000D69A7EB|nr:tetratricopeptide repeat protein [Aquimarina sp. AU474]
MNDNRIDRYLKGEMNDEERNLFLKEINENKELANSVEVFKEMQLIYDNNDWEIINKKHPSMQKHIDFLEGEKGQGIKNVIYQEADNYHSQKPHKLKKIILFAGSIAAILIIGFLLLYRPNDFDANSLYSEFSNDWKELPSLTLRGSDTDLTNAEILFNQEKYVEALRALESLKQKNPVKTDSQLLMYIGVAQLELGKHEEAINTFRKLLSSNTLDAAKAHWYLALSYLKIDNIKIAEQELEIMVNDTMNFKDEEAKDLIDKLKNVQR